MCIYQTVLHWKGDVYNIEVTKMPKRKYSRRKKIMKEDTNTNEVTITKSQQESTGSGDGSLDSDYNKMQTNDIKIEKIKKSSSDVVPPIPGHIVTGLSDADNDTDPAVEGDSIQQEIVDIVDQPGPSKKQKNKRSRRIKNEPLDSTDAVAKRKGKRQGASPKRFIQLEDKPVKMRVIFTTEEKKALLKALQKYKLSDFESICASVPKKESNEVQMFLERMKTKYNQKKKRSKHDIEAPIELWLKMAGDITEFEQDYSSELSQVLSIAGSLEPHDPPRTNYQGDPNWNNIYQYISALLEVDESAQIKLSPIEAAVILDLLQNLSDYLNVLDISQQRKLMQKKYDQMTENYQMYMDTKEIEALTHGLDKDPLVETVPPYVPKKKAVKQESQEDAADLKPSSSGSSTKQTVKKSTLFSINPFSIPVKYLRPNLAEAGNIE